METHEILFRRVGFLLSAFGLALTGIGLFFRAVDASAIPHTSY